MMFANLNAKNNDSKASSNSKLFLKSTLSNAKTQQGEQNVNQFMKMWSKRLVSNDNTISYQVQNYATDKKDVVQQKWRQLKSSLKHTFTNTVYTPLTFYQFHMIDHLHKLVLSQHLNALAESILFNPYIQNFIQILKFTKEIVQSEDVSKQLKNDVVHQIEKLIKDITKTKFVQNQGSQIHPTYTQMQTNILLMIITFKYLQKNYNPYSRRIIRRIFNQLSADSFKNTMETLRYLQNQRPQIQIMPQLTQEELTQRNNKILLKAYDKYRRNGTIPKIHLKKVSQNQRRKVVNILISGFLSEDQDKKSQWQSLLACMPDSEVYGLDWQSQTINNLVGFMATSVKDLLFTKSTLQDKFKDNPFNPAFGVAQQSGKYLAHLVHQLFQNQFINIIGYSLGTQLIKQFVKKTLQLNGGKNLQRIVLLGGVSDTHEYDQILEKCTFPLSITNMYTGNDSVLELLLKKCRAGIQPVGLKELIKSCKHCIDNTDVTKQIAGHLAYMTNFGKIAVLLELSQQ